MDLLHAVILGLIQGLTEFLPISSSAHLILLPRIMGWTDQGLLYDVAAHFGSLLALLAYFRRDLERLGRGWLCSLRTGANAESRLAWLLIIATAPVCAAGFLLRGTADQLREPLLISATTIGFGLLLWWADHGRRGRRLDELRRRDALAIGLLQALAVIPGVSRSGITITAGLMLGLGRQAAGRFAFLLAVPVILAAAGNELLGASFQDAQADWPALLTTTAAAFAGAYATIHYFLKLVERTGMLPYVAYRLLLGGILLALFL